MTGERRPRKPTPLGPAALASFAAGRTDLDPARRVEAAHDMAHALVQGGRASDDPQVRARLVNLVDDHGLELVAQLWADQPAVSLPGALWRVYALRGWVRANPREVARAYELGRRAAAAEDVVAGVAEPPGPDQVRDLADAVLSGVYAGDLAVALERAAAFCRVLSTGGALAADDEDSSSSLHPERGRHATRLAAELSETARELAAAAGAWRAGVLV